MRDQGQPSLTSKHQLDTKNHGYTSSADVTMIKPCAANHLPYCLRALLLTSNQPNTVTTILNSPASTGELIQLQPTKVLLPLRQAKPILSDLAAINQQLSNNKLPPLPINLLPNHEQTPENHQLATDSLFIASMKQQTPLITQLTSHSQLQPGSHCTIGTTADTADLNAAGTLSLAMSLTDIENAVLNGQINIPLPDIIGVEITDHSPIKITEQQLSQALSQQFSHIDFTGKFIEFFGSGLIQLSLIERQQITRAFFNAGACCSFFPIDQQTLAGLASNRTETELEQFEQQARAQQLWHKPDHPLPLFSQQLQLELKSLRSGLDHTKSLLANQPIHQCEATQTNEAPEPTLPTTHATSPLHSMQIEALLGDNICCNQISQGVKQTLPRTTPDNHASTVLFAGRNYGQGPDQQWAARKTRLRATKAVISESFFDSHRHQLACMGVLPLTFEPGDSWQALILKGNETIELELPEQLFPYEPIMMVIHRSNGRRELVELTLQLDTEEEISAYCAGGIVSQSLQKSLKKEMATTRALDSDQ